MAVLTMMSGLSALADAADDDAAFFEFLGSFDAQDEEWLDALLLEEAATVDEPPPTGEPEEDQ